MKLLALLALALGAIPAPATLVEPAVGVIAVSTAAELETAVANAHPGDTIVMADGEYHAEVFATVSGTASAPITLTGSRNAIIVNDFFEQPTTACPSGHTAYGVWLNGASYWHLTGFTIAYSKKGIVVDNATGVQIFGVTVHDIQEEGIHFRKSTTDSALIGSVVHTTGLVKPQFGEGVYIGSAMGNWRCFGESGGAGPDRSDRIRIIGNRIGPNVAAEGLDIKEGTVDGQVIGNFFDGTGITGANSADSWVDAKGSFYRFIGNFGTYRFTPGSVFADGYQTHEQFGLGYGCANTWTGNFSDLGGVGKYAVNVTNQPQCLARNEPNVVDTSNFVINATGGLTNLP